MTGPELNKMEIGNELDVAESNMINGLTLKAFDIDAKKEDTDEMKEVLKNTKIKMITGVDADSKKTMEEKTLVEIADAFVSYVEKGEGWRLKLIESEKDKAPTWINYIVENPQNNDLAYFVQKIAELISYQTARMYTEQELESVKVNVDKTFGNQTRRALVGLKSWIENTGNTTVGEGKKYEGRYLDKSFVEGVISDKKTDEEKSKAIERYNLIYKDGKVQPLDGYAFIDPYSNNYAVTSAVDIKKGTIKEEETGKTDKYDNQIVTITDIGALPIEKRTEKKVYSIIKDNIEYKFYSNGRIVTDQKNYNRTDLIEKKKSNDEWKRKGEVIETEYTQIGKEMDRYINSINTDLSVTYRNDTKKFSISGSSNKYKDDIDIDLINKKITYLNQTFAISPDMPYKEAFYMAAMTYQLINDRASSHGSFAYDAPTGLHFNYIKRGKPDLSNDIIEKNMSSLLNDDKRLYARISMLNECQDKA